MVSIDELLLIRMCYFALKFSVTLKTMLCFSHVKFAFIIIITSTVSLFFWVCLCSVNSYCIVVPDLNK